MHATHVDSMHALSPSEYAPYLPGGSIHQSISNEKEGGIT